MNIVKQPRRWKVVWDPLTRAHRVKELDDEYEKVDWKDIQKTINEIKREQK